MNAHVPLSPSMESLLAAYASGHLGHGMSVLMASFLTLSPVARRQMETFETLNGIMLDDAETVEMSEDALTSLMTRLDAPILTKRIMPPTAMPKASLEPITTCRRRCVPCLTTRLRTSVGVLPIPVSGNCRWALVTMTSALNC